MDSAHRAPSRSIVRFWRILAPAALLLAGCGTTRQSDTPRTAIEQLLISTAVDQVLRSIDFSPLAGKAVYVDERYLDAVDKKYIVASVRYHLLLAGARLKDSKNEADVVVQLWSGGVGTDRENLLIGVNNMPLPPTKEVILPITLPDAPLITRTAQRATVKLGMVAYDAKTGELFADSGIRIAASDYQQWMILGFGPIQSGSVYRELRKHEVERGILARLGGLLLEEDSPPRPARRQRASTSNPELHGDLQPASREENTSEGAEKK